jgi:hypothetical protein
MTHRIQTIAIAAVVSALTVAGMAVAHGGGKGDRHSGKFAFPSSKAFTYSETHLRKDGEDVTLRADQGRVLAASDTAISIERNDGETVEVPVDDNTRLHGIREGKRVIVLRTDDDPAAESVKRVGGHRHRHHDHDHDRD